MAVQIRLLGSLEAFVERTAVDLGPAQQRAVLTRRAALVDELYAGSPRVLAA